MRRADGLYDISRREFCAYAGLAIAAGCTDGGAKVVQTGPLGAGDDGTDASVGGPDGHQGPVPDAATNVVCSVTPTDVGAPGTFVLNTPVYFSSGKFFVVRDSSGLYALTAVCTHEGATCNIQSGDIHCPRHGALFTLNGAVISGPAFTPLVHYGMCDVGNGHVGVMTSQTVAATARLAG